MAVADSRGLPSDVRIDGGDRFESVLAERALDAAFVRELSPRRNASTSRQQLEQQLNHLEERVDGGFPVGAPHRRTPAAGRRRRELCLTPTTDVRCSCGPVLDARPALARDAHEVVCAVGSSESEQGLQRSLAEEDTAATEACVELHSSSEERSHRLGACGTGQRTFELGGRRVAHLHASRRQRLSREKPRVARRAAHAPARDRVHRIAAGGAGISVRVHATKRVRRGSLARQARGESVE